MGLATHLGPWLLGTVKNTTGTTAGTIRNTGATVVEQSATLTFSNTSFTTLFVLPAGAQILNFYVDATQAWNGATGQTITIQTSGGTSLATVGGATTTPLAIGRQTVTITDANIATYTNVGTTDVLIQAKLTNAGTAATTGSAVISCTYVVRNSNGTYQPTAFTS